MLNGMDKTISEIDGSDNSVIDTINLGLRLNDVAVNPQTNLIYVSHVGLARITVIDGSHNSVDESVGVGTDPFNIDVNPKTNMVYGSGNGSVVVLGSAIVCGASGPITGINFKVKCDLAPLDGATLNYVIIYP